jgi:hypothetical protein
MRTRKPGQPAYSQIFDLPRQVASHHLMIAAPIWLWGQEPKNGFCNFTAVHIAEDLHFVIWQKHH